MAARANDQPEADVSYPCPACGAKLYGWTAAHHPIDRSKLILDRCEECGLGVTRASRAPDPAAELAALPREGEILQAPNRRSLQGGIGGAQWAGLEPDQRRLHLNPRSAKLLLAAQGTEVEERGTPFRSVGYATMLQTLINGFTLRDNFFRNARAGRLPRRTGRERAGFGLDVLVTALVAAPLAIVALVLELVGTAIGRGGVVALQPRRRGGTES